MTSDQVRTYDRANSVVFLKTNEQFGGLSNMAGGFPLHVLGTRICTSEALYQACRFPRLPEVQRLIIGQASPMTAKMKSKPHRKDSRADWNYVRVKIMRWCLRVKLAQNWVKFSELLLRTGERPIVEESRKDDFWGAMPTDEHTLAGMNVLGRLLMELREAVKTQGHDALRIVKPLSIEEFLLFGRPIGAIGESHTLTQGAAAQLTTSGADPRRIDEQAQTSFFDAPTVRDAPLPAFIVEVAPPSTLLGCFKPYPAKKSSAVPWLADVPEHWEVQRLRNLADMRVSNVDKHSNEDEQSIRLCNYVDVYKHDYIRSSMSLMRATATREEVERFRLAVGDVLITKDSEAWNDIGVPALVLESADDLVCGYHLALLRPFEQRISGAYLFRTLQSTATHYQFHVEANGVTRYGLSHAAIKSIWLPVPSLAEQAAIVRYLGHADRRIRRYIRSKQKLIKLLEEQKQSIVHRAITRGLDPNARLKPSGVEWLGDVPEHWEVKRCRYIFREVDKRSSDGSEPHLSMSQRLGLVPSDLVENRTLVSESYAGGKLCEIGDLVLNRLKAHLGVFALARHAGVISPDYTVLRPIEVQGVEYFERILRSHACRHELRSRAKGIVEGFWRLYTKDFYDLRLPVPPPQEREEIIDHFVAATTIVEHAVHRAEREAALLHEFRTRLIADVVTGKLDVREPAARLPDEPDEPESHYESEAEDDAEYLGDNEADERPEEAEA